MKNNNRKKTIQLLSAIAAVILLFVVFSVIWASTAFGKFTSKVEQSFDLLIHPVKPIMAAGDDWYRGETPKNQIKNIRFEESEYLSDHPDFTYTESFYADVKNAGTIKCFVFTDNGGTQLIISGNKYNGNDTIFANTDCSGTFSGFTSLESIQSAGLLDVSAVTDFSNTFNGCSALTDLDGLYFWNTSAALDMSGMFKDCSSLSGVTVSQSFNVSGVKNSADMFSGCLSLTGQHGTGFNPSKTDAEYARIDTTNKPGYFLGTTVSISFDANGGTGTMPVQYVLPGVSDTISDASEYITVEGSHVEWWNTEANGTGTRYNACGSITITEDITLYAMWADSVYTIKFDADDGIISGLSEGNSIEVTFGDTYGSATNLSIPGTFPTAQKIGYTFSHWGTFRLPLEYQEVEYIESYGSQYITLSNNECQLGTEFYDIASFTALAGSYNTIVGPSVNPHNFEIYFDGSGKIGKYGSAVIDSKSETGIKYEIAKVTSHTSAGPFVPQLFAYTCSYTLTGRIYLHTQKYEGEYTAYLVPCYRVSDNKPGMYDLVTETFYTNSSTKGDFTVGPIVNGMKEVTAADINSTAIDQTFYAIWIPEQHTVTLKTNDTIGSTKAKGFSDGDAVTSTNGEAFVKLCSPQRIGYIFNGWSSDAGGPVEYSLDETILFTSDITLYAIWSAATYTVSYDAGGGTLEGLVSGNTSTVTFDSTYGAGTNYAVPGVMPTASREGYTFCGWTAALTASDTQLPAEYQEVEYLESTGTQYLVLTNNPVVTNTYFYDKASILKSTGAYNTIIGRHSGSSFEVYYNQSLKIDPWGAVTVDSVTGDSKVGEITEVNSHVTNTTQSIIELFAYDKAYTLTGRIYLHTQKVNDEYTAYLVPCYRLSDNKPGMYDMITQTFYTNSATSGSDFKVGNEIRIDSDTNVRITENMTFKAIWRLTE